MKEFINTIIGLLNGEPSSGIKGFMDYFYKTIVELFIAIFNEEANITTTMGE